MSYEAWGDGDEIPDCAWCEENRSTVEDLAMLVKRLVRLVRKTTPDDELAKKSMDYLRDHDLEHPPIRDDSTVDKP